MPGFFNPHSYEHGSTGIVGNIPQCGKCGLLRKCISPKMEPSGSGKRKILFVGEAPGETEDRQGSPFVGDSGKLLRNVVSDLGIDMKDCLTTNTIVCRPPKNKIEPFMISACRPILRKTIREFQPNVIVALGASALESLLYGIWNDSVGPLSRWTGMTIPVWEYEAWICPTFHPAYLLRQERDQILALIFRQHLEKAFALEHVMPECLDKASLESQVEIIKTPKEAHARLMDLSKRKGILAWDYETTGLKPDRDKQHIVSVSFCIDGGETFAFMMHDSLIEPLKAVLLNPSLKKVASNLKFEERWTKAKLGINVAGWHWDTMLAAHCFDNRQGITSVKFQAFALYGIADYSSHIKPFLESKSSNGLNRIHEVPEDDLLLYNGMDSLLEYWVMVKQKELMNESASN